MRATALTLGLIGLLTVTSCGNGSEHGSATTHETRAATAEAVPAREHEPEHGEESMPHLLEPFVEEFRIIARPGPLGCEGAAATADRVVNVTDACTAARPMPQTES